MASNIAAEMGAATHAKIQRFSDRRRPKMKV
jgi:hypothetical protein